MLKLKRLNFSVSLCFAAAKGTSTQKEDCSLSKGSPVVPPPPPITLMSISFPQTGKKERHDKAKLALGPLAIASIGLDNDLVQVSEAPCWKGLGMPFATFALGKQSYQLSLLAIPGEQEC